MYPKVSIVLVTYLKENDKYLRLCLDSIDNLDYPKDKLDIVLVSSGDHKPSDIPSHIRHHHLSPRHHFPEAVNHGVWQTEPDSKHLLILNDDTILTKSSLRNMVEAIGDQDLILGPISNCDNHYKYSLFFGCQVGEDVIPLNKRFYRYDDLLPYYEHLKNAQSAYNRGLIQQEFLCFYATLIPRSVWNKVGPMDSNFKTGQDDLDYSHRAKQLKIACAVQLDALIWHFGGATADLALTDEIRRSNIDYFTKKWGRLPQ